ncbi:MAG: histidine phosphatase family protein [Proteobacteria bacterium]|nr:histidine phosphatase family protein [Pseudomonadota bacterium]
MAARLFILRHGETVFNAARRLQGEEAHTPLTRLGMEQALAMGMALRGVLADPARATLHSSDSGRALQTAALIAEIAGLDWFAARRSPLLRELGMGQWGGRSYAEVVAEAGPIVDAEHLLRPAPDGEDYPALAARLRRWLAEAGPDAGDHVIVSHGLTTRVLRGLLTGTAPHPRYHAPIAPGLTQGSLVMIEQGRESVVHGATAGGVLA